ncbi:MAG: polyprenyl synthetase family protein [Tannerella sp.]|jgi:geranylgeranyl diphosphate synthase type II|nr:polyprenyl synthetase family protein [Tannerella sp.]
MISFEEILQIVDRSIRNLHFDASPKSLFEPIEYTLALGGKRIRPAFLLMACNLYKDVVDDAITPAIAMEVFHNFTLLHDDLMDAADMRRNQPTVHKKWNRNAAILSGDAMVIASYQFIGKTLSPYLKDVLDVFSQTALEICQGQQYDMEFEQRSNVSESEYLEMIRLKTAVLLACCLKTGAILGDAPEKDADLLYQFGIHIGLLFQLRDDLLDVYGDPATFGKNIGGDILCNKKTFLLIHAMNRASEKQKEIIAYYQTTDKSNFTPEEKIKTITSIYTDLGIKELTEQKMQEYYNKAMYDLSYLSVAPERLSILSEVAGNMMIRES